MTQFIGIDLGTTNSCVAVAENGVIRILKSSEQERTTPSVVCYQDENTVLVGRQAMRNAVAMPQSTVFAVKRLIGRKFTDECVQKFRQICPYTIVAADNGDAWVEIDGRRIAPQEVSAAVLRKVAGDAARSLRDDNLKAVITVPAYFNDSQRQATRDAAGIAGLDTIRIVNEPTAAAMAYGLDKKVSQRIAVYDLGGGTFDVSIIEIFEAGGARDFQVLATGGHTFLGGEGFDMKLVEWLAASFQDEYGIDLRKEPMAVTRMRMAAERAKRELSQGERTEIAIQYLTADSSGPKHMKRQISRSEYEALVGEEVRLSVQILLDTIRDAGLKPAGIDHVILVGGQTRMPLIRESIAKAIGKPPSTEANPDEVVAQGAAILAGVLASQTIVSIQHAPAEEPKRSPAPAAQVAASVQPPSVQPPQERPAARPEAEQDSAPRAPMPVPAGKAPITQLKAHKSPVAVSGLWGFVERLFARKAQGVEEQETPSEPSEAAPEPVKGPVPYSAPAVPDREVAKNDETQKDLLLHRPAADPPAPQRKEAPPRQTVKPRPSAGEKRPEAPRAAGRPEAGTHVAAAGGMGLSDITPMGLGVEIAGGRMHRLIEKNTGTPCRMYHTFTTQEDNQTEVTIHILQGDSDLASENHSLGQFILSGVHQGPAGEAMITVCFELDENGQLNVSAIDRVTGQTISMSVKPSSGLSNDQISAMRSRMAKASITSSLPNAAERCRAYIADVEDVLANHDLVLHGSSRNALEAGRCALLDALAGADEDALEETLTRVTVMTSAIMQRMPRGAKQVRKFSQLRTGSSDLQLEPMDNA